MNKRLLLNHFGLEGEGFYTDDQAESYVRSISADIADNEMVAITGKWGNGKSTLFGRVRQKLEEKHGDEMVFIEVASLDVERLRIPNIMTAVLLNKQVRGNDEPIRRDLESRSLQVIRLLGEAVFARKKRVVIYIENAHDLHARTILALKNLRERTYNGKMKFVSVVLIGQPSLRNKINNYGEIRCRTQSYRLDESTSWMDAGSRKKYLREVFGNALTPEARSRAAAISDTCLGLTALVYETMQKNYMAGKTSIDAADFELPLSDRYEMLRSAHDVSMGDVAKKLKTMYPGERGTSKTTVHNVLAGHDKANLSKVMAAMDAIESELAKTDNEAVLSMVSEAGL